MPFYGGHTLFNQINKKHKITQTIKQRSMIDPHNHLIPILVLNLGNIALLFGSNKAKYRIQPPNLSYGIVLKD